MWLLRNRHARICVRKFSFACEKAWEGAKGTESQIWACLRLVNEILQA